MKIQNDRIHELEKWFFSEHGLSIAQEFSSILDKAKPNFTSGNAILQLGFCNGSLLDKFNFPNKWLVFPYAHKSTDLVAQFTRLPFERDSIDSIISPLVVDAFPDRSVLLDELDRVLKPGGQLIFLGINPISLWGLWLARAKKTCYGKYNVLPKAIFALKNSLIKRNYHFHYASSFYHLPPMKKKLIIAKLLPFPAGFYCLIVQKYSEALTPLVNPIKSKKYQALDPGLQPSCSNTHMLS